MFIKFKYPVNYIAITQEFNNKHNGLDLGWNSNYGGKNNLYIQQKMAL